MKRKWHFLRSFIVMPVMVIFIFISSHAVAQPKRIEGVVTDVKGEPLPGVNVSVKGNPKSD